jgi:hypothetical protein
MLNLLRRLTRPLRLWLAMQREGRYRDWCHANDVCPQVPPDWDEFR